MAMQEPERPETPEAEEPEHFRPVGTVAVLGVYLVVLAQPGIEIYFSVIQRKVLTPNDFADLAEVEQRLLAFERRYEIAAQPFEWKFTRNDLAKLMERIADKDPLPQAA